MQNDDSMKYAIPAGVVVFGLFMGGTLTQGIYAGVLTCAGFWILLKKLRDQYPATYNWIMDHSTEADLVVSLGAAFILGFTVTGIIGAAVVNLLCSVMLDYERENVGKVKDVESANASDVVGLVIKNVRGAFTIVKDGIRKAKPEQEEEDVIETTGEVLNAG